MTRQQNNENVLELEVFALTMDPVYIGTGGYTIGRVDNTIVRDPITNVPKIPGSSLAGTWRYYVVLEVHKYFSDDEFIKNKSKRKNKNLSEIFCSSAPNWIKDFEENRYIGIKCAGQDDAPKEKIANEKNYNTTGHCGKCIVCKGFGFSKEELSWQGMLYFSDLQILFFPVFTIKGTKWITTASRLKEVGINNIQEPQAERILTKDGNEGHLNLGWLYLAVQEGHNIDKNHLMRFKFDNFELKPEDIVIVPESLFPHIVNSNLEVRTSVSIDPITGAAKEKALFTSEAIPRGTILYGNIRIFNKKNFEDIEDKLKPLPDANQLRDALCDSKHYYESLGIGGMTTRGFGRLKIKLECKNNQNSAQESQEQQGGDNNEQQSQQ